MAESIDEVSVKRVLVALSALQETERAVTTALAVAQRLGAQLSGLFVEDVNLLRLAELPFATEIGAATAASQPMQSLQLKRALRRQASQLESMLAAAAERVQVRWSFTVVQGQLLGEALAREADLTVLAGALGPQRLASVKAIAPAGPLLVVFDGSVAAVRALAIGAALAEGRGGELVLLVPAADQHKFEGIKKQAVQWLAKRNVSARIHAIAQVEVPSLLFAARQERAGGLVIANENRALQTLTLQRLLAGLDCPLIVSR